MKADQERVKNLLIDTVTLLCKNSLTYEDELCVEGLLGVKVDQKDVFFVHISETFPSALSVQRAQEAARLRDEEAAAARLRDEEAAAARLRDEDGDGPGTPGSSNYNNKRGHSDSPAHRDSPQSQKRAGSVNIKTENVDSGDDCCITDEPPVLLRTPGSVGAHPAHKVAGQRRPVHSPRSPHTPQQHTDGSYQDQPQFPSNSGYGQQQDYPEFSNVGKHEAREHGEGEPPRKRLAMSGDDEDGGEDDSYSGSQWPNLAGVHGIGDFAGQVAQQAFQDSGDSQMSGGGGDMTGQPGCSTWPTGLQQPAGDTVGRTIGIIYSTGVTLNSSPIDVTLGLKGSDGIPHLKCKSPIKQASKFANVWFFHCHLCNYKAIQKGNLKTHLRYRHREAKIDGNLIDITPGLKGNARTLYLRKCNSPIKHAPKYASVRLFHCHLCDYNAIQKGNLKTHLRCKHKGAKIDENLMDITPGLKGNARTLNFGKCNSPTKHAPKSAGVRLFHCQLCDYKAIQKGNLKTHLRCKHKGAKIEENLIDITPGLKGNARTLNLGKCNSPTKHSPKSAGVQLFHCHLCDYKAIQKGNLKTHLRCKHKGAKIGEKGNVRTP